MAFAGHRVMLSRSLVPPEMFDMIQGTLKENGADVCLCSNPAYNSSSDFHVLPSCESDKFAELQSRGCNVVGPECILRCAKERRPFPSGRYTCCLSLDGIRILPTGFEGSEKVRVQHLVTAMCGELCSKPSMNVDFVVAKNVLAPKYKWSVFTLRKPVLTIDWLVHCFREHRRVPHEPYRLPIFTSVVMCTTGILLDERKKMADLVVANGGILKADLTRECTHLIAKFAEGDKFKVAKMNWCHIKCVNEEWFWNSLSEKVCLEENHYPVQCRRTTTGPQISVVLSRPPPMQDKFSQDREVNASVPGVGAILPPCVSDVDVKGPLGILAVAGEGCQMYLSGCRVYLTGFEPVEMQRLVKMVLGGGGTRHMEFNERVTHVIIGKPAESELKDVRQYALWDAVHVVMPTWLEECSFWKREVAVSAQFVVPEALLSQDCHLKLGDLCTTSVNFLSPIQAFPDITKTMAERSVSTPVNEKRSTRESIPVIQLPQGKLLVSSRTQPDAGADFTSSQDSGAPRQPLSMLPSNPASYRRHGASPEVKKLISPELLFLTDRVGLKVHAGAHITLSNNAAQQPLVTLVSDTASDTRPASSHDPRKQLGDLHRPMDKAKYQAQELIKPPVTTSAGAQDMSYPQNSTTSSSQLNFAVKKRVFEGRVFGFTPSFKACTREEVIQWVLEGGGRMLENVSSGDLQEAEFLICPHGQEKDPCIKSHRKRITTQWIKYCLQEDRLLDTRSHILFQPLCCQVPLPGFERFRFAISQFADRERILLYNLCHSLGAKYQEKKMNRKATHLLCKVGDGDKYEAAQQWGIEVVTDQWLYACVAQNKVVHPDPYRPDRLTEAQKEAGLAIPTQYPAQHTPCDVGVPIAETCPTEIGSQRSSVTQGNHCEGVGVKGKAANIKRKSNLGRRLRSGTLEVQVLHGKRASTNCSLSSQMAGDKLDPWDTASWARDVAAREAAADVAARESATDVGGKELAMDVAAREAPTDVAARQASRQAPTDVVARQASTISEPKADSLRQGRQTNKIGGQVLVSERKSPVDVADVENEEDESGTDVATAIEGLLAQTSKVQSENAPRNPDVDCNLLSPDAIKLISRNSGDLREHSNFKRPKIVSHRSIDRGEQLVRSVEQLAQSVTPAEGKSEKFEETQMDSEVVAYDEDFSEKQRIMERVRTRSMSSGPISESVGNVQHSETMSWKGTQIKRLLKAADANK